MTAVDLAEYTVVQASKRQTELCMAAAFTIWGRNLSMEAFKALAAREEAEGPWAANGALALWWATITQSCQLMRRVLVRRDALDGDVYSGCQTYRRPAFVKRGGSVETCYIYNIASVMTPKDHLRNGYATHMLRVLHYHLGADLPPFPAAWGSPPPPLAVPRGVAAILWSDIGSTFYAKCRVGPAAGYEVDWALNREIHVPLQPPARQASDFDWIYERDLPSVGQELSRAVRAQMATAADGTVRPDPAFSTLDFAPVRGRWLQEVVTNETTGAAVPVGVRVDGAVVLFAPRFAYLGPPVQITLAHDVQPQHVDTVLAALDVVGAMVGQDSVLAFGSDTDLALWEGRRGARTRQRPEKSGHLLAVAWYGQQGSWGDAQIWQWA